MRIIQLLSISLVSLALVACGESAQEKLARYELKSNQELKAYSDKISCSAQNHGDTSKCTDLIKKYEQLAKEVREMEESGEYGNF